MSLAQTLAPNRSPRRVTMLSALRRSLKAAPRRGTVSGQRVATGVRTERPKPRRVSSTDPAAARASLEVILLSGGPGERAKLLISHRGTQQVDELLVTLASEPSTSGTSLALTIPTHSLRPGEACVVPVPARHAGHHARTSWLSGEERGHALTGLN